MKKFKISNNNGKIIKDDRKNIYIYYSNNYKSDFIQLFNFILSLEFRSFKSVTRLNDFPTLKHLSIKQVLSGSVYDSIPRCVVIYSMYLIAPVSDISDNAHTIYDSQ